VEGPRDEYGGAKPDWTAKITGHCSKETTSDSRPYYQNATWTTSQSRHVMDPSWWQTTSPSNEDVAVHI